MSIEGMPYESPDRRTARRIEGGPEYMIEGKPEREPDLCARILDLLDKDPEARTLNGYLQQVFQNNAANACEWLYTPNGYLAGFTPASFVWDNAYEAAYVALMKQFQSDAC